MGLLFSTFGKGYAIVARNIAAQYSVDGAWKLHDFARGAILEAKAASRYISAGFEWLAETASPFLKQFTSIMHLMVSLLVLKQLMQIQILIFQIL
ncbi:hypothetical protein [Flavihumibacter sp. CACIAM 22H1]|uniref:hypothetical protein n=1 Tax=Flavihumibacter sp. CACIAM 22H1 TaxID=1812911 RepID=UPI0007A9357A|nr:hypothetical protein [Flavihumibacter sp. CACIAM 22H1]KYP13820.1 MAG: hypothetical protein A1D16_11430 [Flavihumibacter sp. CACIAM 22H1]